MKKIFTILLVASLLFSAVGCNNAMKPVNERPANAHSAVIEPKVEENTMGANIWNAFLKEVKKNEAAIPENIAEAILENEKVFPYVGDAVTVEPGLLNGFDNAQITGFETGVMFMPVISVIPFVGYVFVLEEGIDTEDFLTRLEENCNLRWNISTRAEQVVAGACGNLVLFVMCPEATDGAFGR